MTPPIIVKNTTGSDILIEDLGVSIPAFDQNDLSESFTLEQIHESVDIETYINNGDFVINNGTEDLTPAQAIRYTSANHNIDEHLDTPKAPASGVHLLQKNEGSYEWVDKSEISSKSEKDIHFIFGKWNYPYLSMRSTTYMVVRKFYFRGSNSLGTPIGIKFVGYVERSGSGSVRIYDSLNENVISEVSVGGTLSICSSTIVNNVPTDESIFDIQFKSYNNWETMYLYGLSIIF